MSKLFSFIGATIGGYLGWWIGARIGFMTGFFLMVLGTGVGMYLGRRLAAEYF